MLGLVTIGMVVFLASKFPEGDRLPAGILMGIGAVLSMWAL